uniref:Skp1_POZ domain-containing protein n=1 Tax=Panagrellus redivivus TaxID=6233 RepID=A0A7E4VK44_PANRE
MPATRESKVTLKSKDNQLFDVGHEVIRECKILLNVFEFASVSSEPVLVAVEGKYLQIAIEFLTTFQHDPPYNPPANANGQAPPPDDDNGVTFWANHSNADLEKVITVAEYLDAPRLIDYLCHVIWKRNKGSTVEQMAAFFDIKDRLTPADLAKLGVENADYTV